jgi:CHAT domain-containing protein/tetratricopeptide (TPR) repeat protein
MNLRNASLALGAAALIGASGHGAGDASALIAEGDALCRKDAYRSAKAKLDRALAQARAEEDRGAEGDALAGLARVEDGWGDAKEAARARDAALALARRAGDRMRESRLLSDAGAGHWQRAEYDAANRVLHAALEGQRAIHDREGEAMTLDRLGLVAFKQGGYDEALRLYAQALTLAEPLPARGTAISVQVDIGLVWLDRHAYARSFDAFERALALADEAGDVEGQVLALDHMGIAYLFQEAPGEARALFERALARARAAQDVPLEMKVQHLLANALRLSGENHEAIDAYTRCAAYCESEGNDREAAWNEARRARAEVALGRLGDAERSLGRALAIWERIRERRPLAYSLYELGRLQSAQGRLEEARATFARALAAQHEIGLPYESLLLADMARLEARLGDGRRASTLAGEAVQRAEAVNNPEMLWTALFAQARVARLGGRREEARRLLARSLDVIESMRQGVSPSDEAKAGFLADKQDVYAEAVDLSYEMGLPATGLEIGERARARAFLDLLAAPGAPGPRPTLREPIAPLVPSPGSTAPATLAEIRAEARRRGAVILAYFTAEPRSFVFSVDPGGSVRAAEIPLGAAALRRQVDATRRALAAGDGRARERLAALHAALLGPVSGVLPRDPERALIIVPHDALCLLPFACLRAPDGTYLVERHTLSYAPALAVLCRPAPRTTPGQSVRCLAVGDPLPPAAPGGESPLAPLPAAAREARDVAALFPPGSGTVLIGPEASEFLVRSLAPRATVVHLATHAFARDDAPLGSYLALAAGKDDDGRLTAREVLGMALGANLVTLSGCDTGTAPGRGEGVSALARAFLHAGARSIIVSLWPVADTVGHDQMTRFYRALRVEGLDEARALRRAQIGTLDALRRGALHDSHGAALGESPRLWAPFVLIGEPGRESREQASRPDAGTRPSGL